MDRYLVKPGSKVSLDDRDTRDTSLFEGGKSEAKEELKALNVRLEELQDLLYAENRRRILIVLQGIDTAGKDGTIRAVFNAMDPLGLRAAAFKAPTENELAHDFLWRIHRQVPRNGEVVIFNRSHYEDVLVVRVHELVPKAVWSQRFEQINHFEKMLAETGTTILKFYLHISKDEQKERLQARLDDPTKRWKFSMGDLDERKLWDQYRAAYEDVLKKTSTAWAPWWIIPSDRKWYRNWLISTILIRKLEELGMKHPEPENLEGVVVE